MHIVFCAGREPIRQEDYRSDGTVGFFSFGKFLITLVRQG
jgi:hypothetical protein